MLESISKTNASFADFGSELRKVKLREIRNRNAFLEKQIKERQIEKERRVLWKVQNQHKHNTNRFQAVPEFAECSQGETAVVMDDKAMREDKAAQARSSFRSEVTIPQENRAEPRRWETEEGRPRQIGQPYRKVVYAG